LKAAKASVAKELHDAAIEERRLDKRKAQLEEQLRLSTPRPDWARPEKILNLQGIIIDASATTTKLKVDDLVKKIKEMRAKKVEYQERLAKWEEEQAKSNKKVDKSQAAANRKYITARGDAANVPKYLRFNGKVRRRDLPKRDVELLVNDCWKQKGEYDVANAEKGAKRSTLEEFLFLYLQKRFGLQAMIAEWGYNLLEALYKYRHDADEEIFLFVLRNKMHEDFYHRQMKMCEDFEEQLNAKWNTGTIPQKKMLTDFLRTFFPSKSEERMDELIEALDEQCPGEGGIEWSSLMEEDRQGDQGPFAECMRDQDLQERQEYLEDIEEGLLLKARSTVEMDEPPKVRAAESRREGQRAAERGGKHAGGFSCLPCPFLIPPSLIPSPLLPSPVIAPRVAWQELDGEQIRQCLLEMDAGHKLGLGERQLYRIMAVGFGKLPSEAMHDTHPDPPPVDPTAVIKIETFVKRILKMTIWRYECKEDAGEERQVELMYSKKSLEEDDEPVPEDAVHEPLKKFTPEEVTQLHTHFEELAKNNEVPGILTKPQFLEAIEHITHAGAHFGERLFAIFDESNDEQIDWVEFRMSMHVLCRGSAEERLNYVFQAYDKNGDGTITRDEMVFFLMMANKVGPKEEKRPREDLKKLCEGAFSKMDLNQDGVLTIIECTRCMQANTWIAELFEKI